MDDRGNLGKFDVRGEPTNTNSGYFSKTSEFDGDREIRRFYFDTKGGPTDGKHGYAEQRTYYEESGMRAASQYFTAAGLELKFPTCEGAYREQDQTKVA